MKTLICFVLLSHVFKSSFSLVAVPSLKRHYGQKLRFGLIKSLQPTSVYTCAEYCLRITRCKKFNFVMETQLCNLHLYGDPTPDSSSFYVNAVDIPNYFAGKCENHNCTGFEFCYSGENEGPTCFPLDILCRPPKEIANAHVTYEGLRFLEQAFYSCATGFVNAPSRCFFNRCIGPVIVWDARKSTMSTKCTVSKAWTFVNVTCQDCFTDPKVIQTNVSTTVTGQQCTRWKDSQLVGSLSEELLSTADNMCRSPVTGTDYDRPYLWCFTDGQKMTYDICSVPRCSEQEGISAANMSISGSFYYQHRFADVPITRLICTNYTNQTELTTHCPISRFESNTWTTPSLSCSVYDCFDNGTEYKGQMSCTTSGRTCQNWNSQTPHAHSYVLSDLNDHNSNYCRNPDGGFDYPWCFTTDPEVRYEYCWVAKC